MGTFKTKARAIELLGKKQIRDSSTALAELMKNSYDADAEILRVEFVTKGVKVPCVIICDNGCGMDKSDIENKWLVVGTDSKRKVKNKKSPGGRTLMGEKGIGRLAVSRLGQQMWMFTKKENTLWNILYINWNIFENPDLYIQDIEVPVLYNVEELEFPEILKKLVFVQKKNLETELWKSEKYVEKRGEIKKQIENAEPDLELVYDFCEIINKTKNQGTVLFVFNLEDNWELYLDPNISVEEDIIAQKNRIRLNSFLSNFGVNEKDFKPEIFLNDKPVEFFANFTDEDYEIYDLKIEGTVENGKFIGKLSARNADRKILDECNEIMKKGIAVTAGINDWQDSDCGKYTIKLCHFEIKKNNSGLTDFELEQIKERMNAAGGISVFRDNVRVLPYGEPENDFLELETRRSKKAGYYLFSHRNMFGRIDITTKDNPKLEDKSSREGLLENKYFYYFIKTLQNLLIQVATDFVGDDKPSSLKLRKSYLEHNNNTAEKREKAKIYEKEQQEQFLVELEKVKSKLKGGDKGLAELEKGIHIQLFEIQKNCVVGTERSYQKLNILLGSINNNQYRMANEIKEAKENLHITISEKFEHRYDPDTLNEMDIFNEKLIEATKNLQMECTEICEKLKKDIQDKIQEWILQFEKGTNTNFAHAKENLQEAVQGLKNLKMYFWNEQLVNWGRLQKQLLEKENELKAYIMPISNYEKIAISAGEEAFAEIDAELEMLEYKIRKLDCCDAESAAAELNAINNGVSECENSIYDVIDRIVRENKDEYNRMNEKVSALLKRLNFNDEEIIDQLMISNYQLKEQVDVYADLANLGLAAEIVNHEFSQLFANVYNAINQVKLQKLPNDVRYYLRQIEIGFRAISDRQSQLSPMYRTKGLRKQLVNIRKMVDDIKMFFLFKLDNQNIQFINDVDADVEKVLSLSKVYPILSNLIYNSLYWVADQKEKKILFHFVEEENSLYIEDTGSGIAARNKERVFEPFFSLKKNGRGLGLAIAKNVLTAQGHDIEVVLESVHKVLNGACFKIIFRMGE